MKNTALNPFKHGLSFRLWLAACIAAPCVLFASPAMSASFDCSKEGSANEKIICNDPELSAMDEQLAKIFKQARKKAADRRAFNAASDEKWLWREKNCHARECLVDWYRKRHTELKASLDAEMTTEKTAGDTAASKGATTAEATVAPAPAKKAVKPQVSVAAMAAAPITNLAHSAQAAVAEAEAQLSATGKPEIKAVSKTDNKPTTGKATAKSAPKVAEAAPAPTLQLALSSTQIDGVAPEGAAARPHYVSANRGEYLYTDPDAKEGDAAPATVSVRYLGIENGQYILEAKRANVYTRYTCSADCALIGALQLPGDVEKDMVILKNDHLSLPSQMVSDAINGLLAESRKR
jgi:uncharacterized protein